MKKTNGPGEKLVHFCYSLMRCYP